MDFLILLTFLLKPWTSFSDSSHASSPSLSIVSNSASDASFDLGHVSGNYIRVKIFPHDKEYPPHGMDSIRTQIRIETKGGQCKLFPITSNGHISSTPTIVSDQIMVAYKYLKSDLKIQCDSPFTIVRSGVDISKNYQYVGALYVYKMQDNSLLAVNELDLEEYLRGVVPAEVSSSWPEQSLKTQSVAARTYARFHIEQARLRHQRYYHVDDTVFFQAYTGLNLVDPRTDKAILETKGEILTFDGKTIEAYYHAHSGGVTANPDVVFSQKVPYCAMVKEPFLAGNRLEWKETVSLQKLSTMAAQAKVIPGGFRLSKVVLPSKGLSESKRVKYVTFHAVSGEGLDVSGARFKKLLNLKSNLFKVRQVGADLVIEGRGFGHGACLNQTGAKVLAGAHGWDYTKILDFYYKNVRLEQKNFEKI